MSNPALRRRLEVMSDDQLTEIVGPLRSTYTAEAVALAEALLRDRGFEVSEWQIASSEADDDTPMVDADTVALMKPREETDATDFLYDYVTNALVILIWGAAAYVVLSAVLPTNTIPGPLGWILWLFYFVFGLAFVPLGIAWIILRILRRKNIREKEQLN